MIAFMGKYYYIDVDEVINLCRADYGTEEFEKNQGLKTGEHGEGVLELNVFKFELFKACIERILNEYEEIDEKMVSFSESESSVSFKIAINTLLKYNLLIEYDNE